MAENYMEKYDYWTSELRNDAKAYEELLSIKNDKEEIEDRFYKDLEFGTGGLRGVLGIGTNRMNEYTVRHATQGIADYINAQNMASRGVVISYDCRHFSREFADASARVLAANGIKAYVFDKMNPTPVLSFAVRYLKTYMGIMITASHNPAKYNGFKVYGDDGAQLNVASSDSVIEIIKSLDIFKDVKFLSAEEASKSEYIKEVGDEVVDAFLCESLKYQLNPDVDKKNLKIVYTPFHGTGLIPVTEVLKRSGYENVYTVSRQCVADPNFSTVKSPNPEEREGFNMSCELAEKHDADIIIGTDPDADRVGVLVKDQNGNYEALNGNQTGVLLTEYILGQRKRLGKISDGDYMVSTIVTTDLVRKISEFYGVEFIKVFTGFKFIAETIKKREEAKDGNYLLGFEESYGYLPGTYARDKDSVTTTLLICEMAAYMKQQGKTLLDVLDDVYKKFGYYTEKTMSVYMEGISGMEDMKKIMCSARENPMRAIGDTKIAAYSDYAKSIRYDFETGKETRIDMQKADVLQFELSDGGFFAMRPSGTEPKIKLYYSVITDSAESGKEKIKYIDAEIRNMFFK